MRPCRTHRLTHVLATLLLAWTPLLAQSTTAVIRGRVTDAGGMGLPGVVVAIRSADQPPGNPQAITDLRGDYRSRPLPVANDYLLKVDLPGFASVQVGPLDLDAGRVVIQDLVLRTQAEATE